MCSQQEITNPQHSVLICSESLMVTGKIFKNYNLQIFLYICNIVSLAKYFEILNKVQTLVQFLRLFTSNVPTFVCCSIV